MIKLGQKVKDKVTGFEGIAVSRVEYLNGCIQYCVKPFMTKKGEMPEGQYIDDNQLKVLGKGVWLDKKPNGGLMSDIPPNQYQG